MISRWRVYIKPFDENGNYQADWLDVSSDIDSSKIGSIASELDNTEYDIGVFRTTNISITLNNINGKYSDVGNSNTIFKYKRSDSLCKVTWEQGKEASICGVALTNASQLTEEITIFTGLINDDSLAMDLGDQKVTFPVLGRESIFQKLTVPDLAISSDGLIVTISIGNPAQFYTATPHGFSVGNPIYLGTSGALPTGLVSYKTYYVSNVVTPYIFELSESLGGTSIATSGTQSGFHGYRRFFGMDTTSVIYKSLNQSKITALLSLVLSNINVNLVYTLDNTVSLRNKTVQELLNQILLATNSVLVVRDDKLFVKARQPSSAIKYTFYGQASQIGTENIQTIKKIKNGVSRIFNFITWKDDETVTAQDATSIAKYGVRKKEFSYDFINDSAAKQSITSSIKTEFANPNQEFDLTAPLDYQTLNLGLLDKVNIDYPVVYLPGQAILPVSGTAVCGSSTLPKALWAFTLELTDEFKIIGRSVDPKANLITFKLRGI